MEIASERGLAYGVAGGEPLLLDIHFAPASDAPRPAVVLIHGGGMWTGSRADMTDMAMALARAGYVAFSIDYRLVDATAGRNRWPAQLDDTQRAVRWVRANAAAFNVDPERVGALGWSAGGQLAALLGMRQTRDGSDPPLAAHSSRVACVVDLAGDVDLAAYTQSPARDEVVALLGGTPQEVPERYRDASPLTWIDDDTVPFLVVHGSADDVVPVAHSRQLVAALQTATVPVTFIELPAAGHHDLDWSAVGPAVLAFFDRNLRRAAAESATSNPRRIACWPSASQVSME